MYITCTSFLKEKNYIGSEALPTSNKERETPRA